MKKRITRLNFISYLFLLSFFLFLQTSRVVAQQKDTLHTESKLPDHRKHIYFSNRSERSDTIFISSHSNIINDKIKQERNISKLVKSNAAVNTQAVKNTFTVTATIALTVTSSGTTCGYSNGSFTVTATGGTAPYMYSENGYPFQPTGIFLSKAAGLYNITVTDAAGLTATTSVTLTNTFSPPSLNFFTYTNPPACNGTDGTITLLATGGTPPYLFSDDYINWQSSSTITNLPASWFTYSFLVKDANGCIAPFPFFFGYDCSIGFQVGFYGAGACGADGKILVADPQGGTAPYTYSLDGINYQTNPEFDDLDPRFYDVYVKDATGFVAIKGIQMFPNCLIDVVVNTTDATCGVNNGSLTITASNGTTPYFYSLDGVNFQTSNIFNGLSPGSYTITVTDGNGDYGYVYSVIIYNNCPIISAIATNETCNDKNGIITASVENGTAPFSYSIDGINFQTSNLFSALMAGTYTVTVKDVNNFTADTTLTLNNICITISDSIVNATCGNDNGSIIVSATTGTAPYQYSIDGTDFQTGNIFSNLAPGNYIVTVKDAAGLINTATAIIKNIAGPQISANALAASCANNDGQIICIANRGTSPFKYSLNNATFQNNSIFTGLDTGTYIATVQDSNGCISFQSINVPLNNTITVNAGNDVTICEGTNSILNVSTNGTIFSWTPSAGLNNTSIQDPSASPDVTTKYYVTASSGICTAKDSVSVIVNAAPIANPGMDTSICLGKSIQLNGAGGNNFLWSPSTYLDNTNINDPLVNQPANTISYHLVVTDANGCKSLNDNSVTITITPTAKIFAGNDTAVVIDQPFQLNAIDINNSGFTQYTWSPPIGLNDPYISNPVANISGDINYTVVAITPDGCEGSDTISIKAYTFSDIFVPNAFTPNGDGHNDLLRAVLIGIKEFKYFAVYNRYGQQIFYSTNPSLGWDGKVNGTPQNTNTFVWVASGTDYNGNAIFRKGTVVLIR
jgi:gliding motility-associated-like protein